MNQNIDVLQMMMNESSFNDEDEDEFCSMLIPEIELGDGDNNYDDGNHYLGSKDTAETEEQANIRRSNAQQMREYRSRQKQDPIKYRRYLERERIRNNKRKRNKRMILSGNIPFNYDPTATTTTTVDLPLNLSKKKNQPDDPPQQDNSLQIMNVLSGNREISNFFKTNNDNVNSLPTTRRSHRKKVASTSSVNVPNYVTDDLGLHKNLTSTQNNIQTSSANFLNINMNDELKKLCEQNFQITVSVVGGGSKSNDPSPTKATNMKSNIWSNNSELDETEVIRIDDTPTKLPEKLANLDSVLLDEPPHSPKLIVIPDFEPESEIIPEPVVTIPESPSADIDEEPPRKFFLRPIDIRKLLKSPQTIVIDDSITDSEPLNTPFIKTEQKFEPEMSSIDFDKLIDELQRENENNESQVKTSPPQICKPNQYNNMSNITSSNVESQIKPSRIKTFVDLTDDLSDDDNRTLASYLTRKDEKMIEAVPAPSITPINLETILPPKPVPQPTDFRIRNNYNDSFVGFIKYVEAEKRPNANGITPSDLKCSDTVKEILKSEKIEAKKLKKMKQMEKALLKEQKELEKLNKPDKKLPTKPRRKSTYIAPPKQRYQEEEPDDDDIESEDDVEFKPYTPKALPTSSLGMSLRSRRK